jgi:hypothetical protein
MIIETAILEMSTTLFTSEAKFKTLINMAVIWKAHFESPEKNFMIIWERRIPGIRFGIKSFNGDCLHQSLFNTWL